MLPLLSLLGVEMLLQARDIDAGAQSDNGGRRRVTPTSGRASRRPALALWMNGDFVSTWRQDAGGVDLLDHDVGGQTAPQGRPLSLSLPFTPGGTPRRGDMVRTYFENLLPDSQEIRTLVQVHRREPHHVARIG